jgi:hypothetical protein
MGLVSQRNDSQNTRPEGSSEDRKCLVVSATFDAYYLFIVCSDVEVSHTADYSFPRAMDNKHHSYKIRRKAKPIHRE